MAYELRVRPGQTLDGRFRIEREAGAGGMGLVFRAEDLHTREPVALKVLRADRAATARFRREARVLAQLRHPAIVQYVAHGESAGAMYLAMEWLDGEDLAERLARGPLSVADAVEVARRIADALAVAHTRGVVHRDLKPGNLFLPSGSIRDVKLLDFGVARVQAASVAMTGAGAVIGTPGYMAPEQVRGESIIDARADVFALGCVLFECLAGRPTFAGESTMALLAKILMEDPPRVSEVRSDVPPALDEIVARMLAKSATDRYTDGAAVRDALGLLDTAHLEEAAPQGARRSAITRGEQHVVSVVIASGKPASITAAHPVTEVLEEALADGESAGFARTELVEGPRAFDLEVLTKLGAHVGRLADGAIVATLHGAGSATDQVAAAARCALALRALVPESPIVLATGRAVFAGRLPIGAVIERAAKLLREGASEPNAIHLDEVTAGLLPSRFVVRAGPIGAELAGEERSADVARTVLGRTTRFVGRDAEMGTLTGLYAQVETDTVPRAVIVTGAPGLGKSRLRAELVAQLERRDPAPAIWMGAAEQLGAGTPLALLRRVIRDGLSVTEGTGEASRIVEHVGRRLPAVDAMRVATFVAELAGVPLDSSPDVPHADAQLQAARREPPLMAEQMRRAFVDLVRAECAARPLVIVLEDAHWGDLPTMKLVAAALELAESPLMVIAFARPEIEDAFPALWADRSVLRLSLGSLAPRAAERLARDVLGSGPATEAVQTLVAQAAGNPFFLEELLRAYVAGASTTMPETLIAVVHKRLEALDEDSRRVLRAASVYGVVFWRGSATTLLQGAADLDVDRCLADLVEREIVVRRIESRFAGEVELEFRHAIVRDAAYQMLPDTDRIAAHRFAGEWLEASGEVNRALLAEHFELGGDGERATRCYAVAAIQALHADDLDACLRLAKRGLDVAADDSDQRGALHLARAEAHHWRAELDAAHAESSEALHLLQRGSDAWFAAGAIAVSASAMLGKIDDAVELASELSRAGAKQRGTAFLVAAAQCVAFLPQGPTTDELLALLPTGTAGLADALLAARIEVARGMRAQANGNPTLVLEHFACACEHFERAGHLRGARAARQNVGYASTELGRHEEAERLLRDVLADAQRAAVMTTVAWCLMHLGMVVGRLGRASEALSLLRESAELARKQGSRRLEAEVAVVTADVFNASGATDLAVEQAERALQVADVPALRAAALAALATARVAAGNPAGAHDAAMSALTIVDAKGGAEDAELAVRVAHAEALRAVGRTPEAVEALTVAKSLLHARAAGIPADDRQTFLRRVPINARILQLDDAWSNDDV